MSLVGEKRGVTFQQDEPVHVIPLGQEADIEHTPGEELVQRWPQNNCWACQQGICWQRVAEVYRNTGNPSVIVHGTRAAS